MNLNHQTLLTSLVPICRQASAAILNIYEQKFEVQSKADHSPLTQADLASHHCIVSALNDLTPNIPILSEESDAILESKAWREWDTYWLVDPLDGTKEFIKRNGEFTVNIALIHQHQAVLGIVHVPTSGISYLGSKKIGAFKLNSFDDSFNSTHEIRVRSVDSKNPVVMVSRSHPSPELQDYLNEMGEHEVIRIGSSLKFCLIAEGKADHYPRFGPTSEWDTAAGQAVVEAAGGCIITMEGEPLRYNLKDEILNPHFMVSTTNTKNI